MNPWTYDLLPQHLLHIVSKHLLHYTSFLDLKILLKKEELVLSFSKSKLQSGHILVISDPSSSSALKTNDFLMPRPYGLSGRCESSRLFFSLFTFRGTYYFTFFSNSLPNKRAAEMSDKLILFKFDPIKLPPCLLFVFRVVHGYFDVTEAISDCYYFLSWANDISFNY